jgi:hypothetical protein
MLTIWGCTKHSTPTATPVKAETAVAKKEEAAPVSAPVVSAPAPAPTPEVGLLIGQWKLQKIEIPDMAQKMSAFGDQASKEAMTQLLDRYTSVLQDLSVSFNADSTYQSSYKAGNDIGTWVLMKNEIRTISKITSRALVYQIISMDDKTIKVNLDAGDNVIMLMTFNKN